VSTETGRPVALVTGGGSGIGLAVVHQLAEAGYDIGVLDVNLESAEKAAAEVRALGVSARAFRCDVRSSSEVSDAVNGVVEAFGRLNVAVNNAGMGVPASDLVDLEESDWDLVIDITLKGVWLSMKYEIPHLLNAGGGAIVNTASIFGLVGSPNTTPAYVAAKHGVVGLTKTAALHYATNGIRVNAVAPATIDTPAVQARIARDPSGSSRRFLESWQPMDRMGSPAEVAAAITWLCSDAASFVTGAILPVDGGYTAQ